MSDSHSTSRELWRLRVLVVEQSDGTVSSLLLADGGLEVGTVASMSDAEKATQRTPPEVLVFALDEPTSEHSAALETFRNQFMAIPVLVVSAPAPERIVTALIKAGAGGYLFSDEASLAPTAVREVAQGRAPMSLPVSRIVLGRARRNSTTFAAVKAPLAAPVGDVRLTTRQCEILELLAGGHSYEDIGTALNLSLNTVRSHVKALYERLEVTTKVEAVRMGIELRVLTESGARREPHP